MVNIKSRDDVKNQSRTHDKPARRFMNISRPFVNNAERQASSVCDTRCFPLVF